MEHDIHIDDEPVISMGTKLVAALVVIVALCCSGAYVVYGSGMWNPAPQHDAP
jgi:hypothetical protein